MIERIEARYDVQEVEFGKVYRWCPESAVVECDCGERETLKWLELTGDSGTTCKCGANLAACVREDTVIKPPLNEDERSRHPWRSWRTSEDTGLPY